ncbi:APC family permease [Acidisoma cellulosilytica]|uniref:APC family permease n=1 Tax=Acidisoma cellulosilyticum TaxID=2802395 RepID=A0A964E3W3_9PROT|nr:APC family permease [Acidisoma cellulosilyticum]MCB8881070.1 APC family permease [Acidisoma cellulosilyticum]
MRPDASPTHPTASHLSKIYTRDATGLRKEAGPFDIFIYNVNNQNIALGVIFLFGGLASYPGGSFALTVLIATLLVIPIYVVYSRLSADMPRSGGDYVWVSRIMGRKAGPLLGFTVAATWIMSAFVSIGAPMAFMAQFGIAPFLRELGSATGSLALSHAGDWVYSNNGTIIVGGLFLIAFTIVMLVGVRTYMTLQRYAFFLACIGLVIGLLCLVFTGHTSFAASFDAYVKSLGGVDGAFALAEKAGGPTAGHAFSAKATYYASIWSLYMVLFGATSCYIGGEVRQPARTQRLGMFGSLIFTAIGLLLLIIALLHVGGEAFFMGLGSAKLGLAYAPTYNELIYALFAPSVVGALVMGVTFFFWTYVWMPINYFTATRLLLALSLDGYLPRSLSKVNSRFGTPHIAILICGLFGLLSLYLFVTGVISTVTLVFACAVMFVITGIAAVLYPFTMRRTWEASGAKRFLGVPTIAFWGALQTVFSLIVLDIFWADPVAGISLSSSNIILNVGAPILAFVVAALVIAIRRSGGTDLGLATAEIPVE